MSTRVRDYTPMTMATSRFWAACAGIDPVIAYDAASGAPESGEKRRWVIGAGPSGLTGMTIVTRRFSPRRAVSRSSIAA